MLGAFEDHVHGLLGEIRSAGLWKPERVLASPQRPQASLHGGQQVLVLCANNYLGLADHPQVIAANHAPGDRGARCRVRECECCALLSFGEGDQG